MKLLGLNPRSPDAGLIISGQESPAILGNNAEGSKPRLEKSAGVGSGCPAKRRAGVGSQIRRRKLRRPGTGFTSGDRPGRTFKGAERRLMVVIAPAREALEIQRFKTRPHVLVSVAAPA